MAEQLPALPALGGEAEATAKLLEELAEAFEFSASHFVRDNPQISNSESLKSRRLRTLAAALRSGGTPDTTTEEPTK